MKKDRLKDLEDRYWEGKTSLADEQCLKEVRDNTYFKSLKAAKKEQMDWGFDDFIHQAEEVEERVIQASEPIGRPIWKYMAIVAALFLTGFLFLKDRRTSPDIKETNVHVVQEAGKEGSTNLLVEPDILAIIRDEKEVRTMPQRMEGMRQEARKEKPVQEYTAPNEEAYVLVNGMPIYDESEAEKIVLASLQLMADNLQEGREAVEKMKYIKVKL